MLIRTISGFTSVTLKKSATKPENKNMRIEITTPRIIEINHAALINLSTFSSFCTKNTLIPVSVSISRSDKTNEAIP